MSARMGKVVVKIAPQLGVPESGEHVIGRYPGLGIWAYGSGRAEVLERLKVQFRVLIESHRKRGRLEHVLEESGLTWWTVDEARRQGIAFEDLSPEAEQAMPQTQTTPAGSIRWDFALAQAA